MAVRREKVVLDLETNFVSEAAKAAAAIGLLNEEIDRLGKRSTSSRGGTRAVSNDLKDVERQAKRTGSEVDKLSGRMRIFADVAAVLGPGLIPIGAVGIPAIAGLASSMGFATLAAGTMIGAFQGVGDALEALNKAHLEPTAENINAARLAMSQISPAARDFTRELSSLEPALKGLRDAAAENLFPGLTVGFEQLQTALPAVRRIVGAVAGELGDLSAAAGKSLASPEWASFFKFLADEAPQALADMGHGVGNVAHAMAQLWMAFAPLNRGFSSWIVDATEKFDTWASHLSGTNGFQDFISYIQHTGPEVGAALGAIANAVLQIVEAAAPLGGPVLKALTGIANAIAAVADSDLGTPIFTALAALALYNRGLQLSTKLGASSFGSKAKAQLAGYADALLNVTTAEQRASRSVQEAGLIQRARFGTLARGAGQIALLGVAASGLADKFGLANTASLALAGSMIEPGLGTAIGATAGLFLDAQKAGEGFNATLDKLNATARGGSIEAINKQLAAAHAQIKDINNTSGVGDFFSDIGKTKGVSLLAKATGGQVRSPKADKDIASAQDAANMLSLAAATKAQGAALVAASHGYELTGQGAREAAGGIAAFTQAATAANNAISKQSDYDAYKSALLDAADALKANGRTLDSNTRAGLANRASLRAVASGALAAAGEMTNFSRRVQFVSNARKNFISLATGMGMSRAAARALANQLGLIPRVIKPKVTVETGDSAAKLAAIRAQIAALHDKNIHIGIIKRNTTGGEAPGGGATRTPAAGGQMRAMFPGETQGPTDDTIPAMLSHREWVMPVSAVDYYGESFMSAVQAGAYAAGGQVLGLAAGGQAKHSTGHHNKHKPTKSNSLQHAIDKLTAAVENETSARDDLVSKRNDLSSTVGGGFLSDPFALGSPWSKNAGFNPLGVLRTDTANAKHFQGQLAQLRKNGVSGQALAAIASTSDTTKASQLLALGAGGDKQYTSLFNQRAAASNAVGAYAGNAVYAKAIAYDNAKLASMDATLKRLERDAKHRHADTKKDRAHNTDKQTKAVNGSAGHSQRHKKGKVKSAR